jgi:hypothetical protein
MALTFSFNAVVNVIIVDLEEAWQGGKAIHIDIRDI